MWQKKKINLECKTSEEIHSFLRQKALRFLSLKPRLRAELEKHLVGIVEGKAESLVQSIEEISSEFEKLKFLNDHDLIERYCHAQLNERLRGLRWIEMKLVQRGATRNLIKSVTAKISPLLELEAAKKLAQKKFKDGSDKGKAKFMRLLASRGFSGDTIRALFDYDVPN